MPFIRTRGAHSPGRLLDLLGDDTGAGAATRLNEADDAAFRTVAHDRTVTLVCESRNSPGGRRESGARVSILSRPIPVRRQPRGLTMHTFRKTTRARTLGVLGLTAAALLTVTACDPSDDKAGATPPPESSASTSAAPSASAPSSAETSAPGRPGEAAGDPTGIDGNCPADDTDVKVEWALPPTKDDSKLLLTVTNTSTEPCKLRTYPVLRLEDGDGRLVPVFQNSKPRTEVTLNPGKEAYAGLLLRQSNSDVSTLVKNLALAPHGQSPDTNTGEGALLELPKGGVRMDDKARVTYWNSSSRPPCRRCSPTDGAPALTSQAVAGRLYVSRRTVGTDPGLPRFPQDRGLLTYRPGQGALGRGR